MLFNVAITPRTFSEACEGNRTDAPLLVPWLQSSPHPAEAHTVEAQQAYTCAVTAMSKLDPSAV